MTEQRSELEVAARLHSVRSGILAWFDLHQRSLPWRETRDPYRVLVSEVMLQQTQVDRVLPYYEQFLEKFPTVASLAGAPTADVIRLWAGLGYNRRAVNLQRASQAVVERYGGVFPRTVGELRTLPGVGDYTAGAIACFAFEEDVAFLDTNMQRVIERIWSEPGIAQRKAELLSIAQALVPPGNGWQWNQALIEFGALHCTARKPLCGLCPLQRTCGSFPDPYQMLARRGAGPSETFEGSNRYFRGRILAALRDKDESATGLPLSHLGELVRSDFTAADLPWLRTLVHGLERDGLARIAESQGTYDASPVETRVTLP